jgi:hypothetical protein
VASKKRLVHGDILDSHDAVALLHVKDTIHQKKRIAVGNVLLNLENIHHTVTHRLYPDSAWFRGAQTLRGP